jgi:ribosomal protein L16 Arg81 hydroxylase
MKSKHPRTCATLEHPGKKHKAKHAKSNSHSTLLVQDHVKKAPEINGDNLLSTLIFPLSAQEFMQHVFRKSCYAFLERGQEKIQELVSEFLFGLDLVQMMNHSASDSIHVWMVDQDTGKIESFKTDPDAALICYRAGASLYFRSSEEMAQVFIGNLLQDLGMEWSGRFPDGLLKGEIEVFISRKGHKTSWHFDFQENFTIQINGAKTWHLAESESQPTRHPVRGFTPHYSKDESGALQTQKKVHHVYDPSFSGSFATQDIQRVCLYPGDVLYHPAGVWHQVEALEDSVSINLSIFGTTWADLLSDVTRQVLWRSEETRQMITYPSIDSAAQALKHIKAVISSIEPEDLLPLKQPSNARFYTPSNELCWNHVVIHSQSVFGRNSLVSVVESDEPPELTVDDQSDSQSESEVASDEECGGIDTLEDSKWFVAHHIFGNPEVESSSSVYFKLNSKTAKLMQQCLSDPMKYNKQKNLSEDVQILIRMLIASGVFSIRQT